MPEDEASRRSAPSRAVHLVLTAVIGLSFVGFFLGIQQGTPQPDFERRDFAPPAEFADAIRATTYAQFDRREHSINRSWRSVVADIDEERAPPPQARFMGRGVREAMMARRAARRAYDGAPPTVPHPIEQVSTAECLVCHASARYLGKNVYTPAMSHELMPNCTQCHIEQESASFDTFLVAANSFDGIVRVERGFRAWYAAPPRVPHTIVMRDNCLSCHGPAGAQAIRTEHPWDAVCLQCHFPANLHEQYARPGTLRRLGILESLLNELDSTDNADE